MRFNGSLVISCGENKLGEFFSVQTADREIKCRLGRTLERCAYLETLLNK